jgi:large subunit ribosomal protein L21e
MPHSYYLGKTGSVYNVTQHTIEIVVNKQVKDRVLAN